MIKYKNFILCFLTLMMTGCAAMKAPEPTESQIQASPFVIIVPKDIPEVDKKTNLKGVELISVSRDFNGTSFNAGFRYRFTVKFREVGSDLITSICQGQILDVGNIAESCIFYDAHISVLEKDKSYEVSLTPYRQRSQQARGNLFIPVKLPDVVLDDWYDFVSDQFYRMSYKATSQYSTEAVRGNFDRILSKNKDTTTTQDAMAKQFKNSYNLDLKNNVSSTVYTGFYPYKTGSIAEMYIVSHSFSKRNIKSVNWYEISEAIKEKINATVNN